MAVVIHYMAKKEDYSNLLIISVPHLLQKNMQQGAKIMTFTLCFTMLLTSSGVTTFLCYVPGVGAKLRLCMFSSVNKWSL